MFHYSYFSVLRIQNPVYYYTRGHSEQHADGAQTTALTEHTVLTNYHDDVFALQNRDVSIAGKTLAVSRRPRC